MSDVHEYMNQIHTRFEAAFGEGFLSIGPDLLGNENLFPRVKDAHDAGVAPDDFVRQIGADFSLVPGDRHANRYRASLVAYAQEIEGWEPDGRGGIVAPGEDAVLRIAVEGSGGGAVPMEFVVQVAEGATLGEGIPLPDESDFVEVARGRDISLALANFEADYVPGATAPRMI